MIVLALSSGTSVDAIDVAVADLALDGALVHLTPLRHEEVAFSPGLRNDVLEALPPRPTTMEEVCRLDTRLGQELATAAAGVMAGLPAGQQPGLIATHGQTLFHWVEDGAVRGTLQLGQPAWIAEATGLPVVSDLRVADVAAGGQGAPLAALLDVLLLGDRAAPAAALNLGGIGNVTVTRPGGDPVAFDTGPANALLDAAMRRATEGREHVDAEGRRAARGRVHPSLLDALLAHPYYRQPPPRTTGKELFGAAYLEEVLDRVGAADVPVEDLLATLVELTARTVADALTPYRVGEVLASGGGTHNPVLMRRLAELLGPARLTTSAALGLDPSAKESYLFALLGLLTWHGLPGTVAGCTGARRAPVAGRITPGARALRLPDPATTTPTGLRVHAAPT